MVRKVLCDNESFIAGVTKIVVSVSSVLLAAGMIWIISTVNATENRLTKACSDVESNNARIDRLESSNTELLKTLSHMDRKVAVQGEMLKFVAKQYGYKE